MIWATIASTSRAIMKGGAGIVYENYGPTVRGRKLALELRRARDRAGMTPAEARQQLDWSQSKISRIENARTRPSRRDVEAALDLYGTDASTRALLLQLHREVERRGWWMAYSDVFRGSFVAFENDASHVRSWQPQLVPGLLQGEAYAREVIAAARPLDPSDVHRRVTARMTRRMLLTRPNAPRFHAVIDEGALRRRVGGNNVMREQIDDLLRTAEHDNVTIQVMPFEVGAHAGLEGPFVLLSYADEIELDLAYAEIRAGDVYVESAEGVADLRLGFERIAERALPPEDSMAKLHALKEAI
jgi:transcriptional regulator with XRE-family HTH domain